MESRNRTGLRHLLPELDLFETKAERGRAWDKAYDALTRRWSWWLCLLGMFGVIGSIPILGPNWLVPLVGRHFSIPAPIILAIPGPVVGFSFGVVMVYIYRQSMRRSLREMLVARGVAICIHCGYNLHGLTEARCPECGKPFDENLISSAD